MAKKSEKPEITSFSDLGLPKPLLQALTDVGYEAPSPIQAETIPLLLAGHDLLGHAPTGTGKTAAFSLPLLARINPDSKHVQIMVLTPTRELTIQVAEALKRYAAHMPGFHVLPIYGGQGYAGQIGQLKRGVQAVVGTPGRVMDHMRKGTLKLDQLNALVLDEADEMLRMGFLEDVEWILEHTHSDRQIALFSATMPKEIQRIARSYLKEPREISIESKTTTATTIRQRYWQVSHVHKLDALTRLLEVEHYDGLIMFVRTKLATIELAEKLEARGHAAAALNGDMPQQQREQTIEKLKKGQLDILVATDVAARGLDVERITHVVNYDIPYDTEAYVHRIGRTGRAGRAGDAILFVAPRERRMLSAIEKATRQPIEELQLPSTETVNNHRIARFKQRITDAIGAGELEAYIDLLDQYRHEHQVTDLEIMAALAKMVVGDRSLLLEERPERPARKNSSEQTSGKNAGKSTGKRVSKSAKVPPEGMERYRIEVGHDHGVKPANIVGAIANEAGLDAEHIGHIDIHSTHCVVDLPQGMPRDIFRALKKVWVCGRQLQITHEVSEDKKPTPRRNSSAEGKGKARTTRRPNNQTKTKKAGARKPGTNKPGTSKTVAENATESRSTKKAVRKRPPKKS